MLVHVSKVGPINSMIILSLELLGSWKVDFLATLMLPMEEISVTKFRRTKCDLSAFKCVLLSF